ncbi:MAG TPA: hypothetical protein IAB56_07020 [Candidatus Scybalousia intestinigallinarum]|nr:hypothetical protein [Candidatus Scybalousia intestinigallinarum]
MNKEKENIIKKYNEHAKFMADIAIAVLAGNKSVLEVNGVKEIIALYLLIPYITSDQLETPGEEYIVPKITENFSETITIRNLRNAICHSFVTTEEKSNDGSGHGDYLILDDRAIYNRNVHEKLTKKSGATCIGIDYTHKKLEEFFKQIIDT